MHILLVNHAPIPVFAYGGTERVVWDLGKQLVQMGHRLTYLVPAGSRCDFAEVRVIDPAKGWREQIPADVDIAHFQFDPGFAPGAEPGRHCVAERPGYPDTLPDCGQPCRTAFWDS